MSKLPGSVPRWKVINALQREGEVIRHRKHCADPYPTREA